MVAYSFKERFCEPILAGTKGGTIRAHRYRHARPGEEVQLYFGMRTKHCRLIARKTCLAVDPISIDWRLWRIEIGGRVFRTVHELASFARFDGFIDISDMRLFWLGDEYFVGYHIRWAPLPEPLIPWSPLPGPVA